MALEQWGPLRRRTDVRLALFTGSISVILVVAGSITLVLMRDVNAIGVGLLGLGYCYSVLWPLRERWRAWRRIGAVALDMADLNIVPGDPAPCDVVITPRRDASVKEICLILDFRESRGGGGTSAWQVDVPIADPLLRAGVSAVFSADIVLPPGVPPSFFDSGRTRQWSVTGVVTLVDGSRWEREYPVMVYPTP
jgi:hypothetical protein